MYIKRLIEESLLKELASKKVLFLLGARQVGKTTLIQHITTGENVVLLNMDIATDQARLAAAANLDPPTALRSLNTPRILVIDEAHRAPHIGRLVKGWYDAGLPVKIILLGSSSMQLLDEAAAELTGRNQKFYLTPLLFSEVLTEQSWWNKEMWASKPVPEALQAPLTALLDERLLNGSYPESYLMPEPQTYLLNLVDDYLLKDIWQTNLIRSPETVRKLLTLLAHQISAEVSTSELAAQLAISRLTVEKYLGLLERIFVIFRLPAYSTNPRKEVTKSKKIYFWDTGVRNALLNEFQPVSSRPDRGTLWENWVVSEFMKLNLSQRRYNEFFFWRTRSGREVDLIIKHGQDLQAIEIKWSASSATRPTRAFERAYGVNPTLLHRANVVPLLLNW